MLHNGFHSMREITDGSSEISLSITSGNHFVSYVSELSIVRSLLSLTLDSASITDHKFLSLIVQFHGYCSNKLVLQTALLQ